MPLRSDGHQAGTVDPEPRGYRQVLHFFDVHPAQDEAEGETDAPVPPELFTLNEDTRLCVREEVQRGQQTALSFDKTSSSNSLPQARQVYS
jgi:hypothetical protein